LIIVTILLILNGSARTIEPGFILKSDLGVSKGHDSERLSLFPVCRSSFLLSVGMESIEYEFGPGDW
jgi:hypothetical protein